MARVAASMAGASMMLSAAAPLGAQTVADLQAQINALLAQLAALQGGASACASFTQDLTVGSTGSQVVALQQMLVAKGYLTMPAGTAYGYFGSLTKAGVARWQAANGVSPAAGYWGPKSRAAANVCAAGAPGTTTGGTTVGGTAGASAGITTPGAEGTLTVTAAPVSSSTFYEGESNATIQAFKAKATGSDLSIQRVKVDLGSNSDVYLSALSKVQLVDDAGKVLASADMNSSNVVKNSAGQHEVTLSGFSSIVSKGTERTYRIQADVRSSVDTDARTSYTIRLAANGVRAVDGAGIDLYSPVNATDVSRSITIAASLAKSATLAVSTNSANPQTREMVAAGGASNNEADKVALLVFDIRAEKDAVKITDLKNFSVTRSGGSATASTTYLFEGSGTGGAQLGSAAVSGSTADFTNLSYVIPANTTRTFTLAADIRSAGATQTTIDASFTGNATNVVGERQTDGKLVTGSSVSGSADANDLLVRNIGPVFSLVGTPSISRNPGTSGIAGGTSSASASFTLKVTAVGADVLFGTSGSTTWPMVSNGTGAPARSFDIYLAGAVSNPAVASSTSASKPSSGVVDNGSESFTLQRGHTVEVPVSFLFEGRTSAGALISTGQYAVGLERINWVSGGTRYNSTFMDGKTEWRTGETAMP